MAYKALLADADGTLFDFHRGEREAITHTFTRFGIACTEENLALYRRANEAEWKRLEKGETTQQRLRTERFETFLRESGLKGDAEALSECFVESLGRQRFPLPGARAFLERISAKMPVILVTNGIARVQRSRFLNCELTPYLSGVVISEEVGQAKPHPAMVEEALRMAGIGDRRLAVLMGDSVTADIGAAKRAGVDSILFTNGAEPPVGHGATYAARTYTDAESVILGGASCLLP